MVYRYCVLYIDRVVYNYDYNNYYGFFFSRYEQMAEQEENNYQQLRRKLYTELQLEKDKLAAEVHGRREAIEGQMNHLKVCTGLHVIVHVHNLLYLLLACFVSVNSRQRNYKTQIGSRVYFIRATKKALGK